MAKGEYVTVTNISGQMIPLQLRPEGGDFFIHERQARLLAGKSITVPRNYINQGQIDNLRARHEVRVSSN